MKLFTTAAMAMALMGVAAAAHADDQKDHGSHAAAAHAPPPSRPAPPPQHAAAPAGPSHAFNPGASNSQHFNAQSTSQGHPNWQAQGGPAGGQTQHFGGQQSGQRWNGQSGSQQHGQASGQQSGQRWNGQAGSQQHGQASGQVQQWNGQRSGQHFNGQVGVSANLGFQNHAPRARDQGRSYYSAGVVARSYRAPQRFRFGGYRSYPSGWGFRTWNFGDFLPYGWFSSQYYLSWSDYGLPPPPIGCEWVAEGPDAVLVDVWTGQVLSVYRGAFYWNGY